MEIQIKNSGQLVRNVKKGGNNKYWNVKKPSILAHDLLLNRKNGEKREKQ